MGKTTSTPAAYTRFEVLGSRTAHRIHRHIRAHTLGPMRHADGHFALCRLCINRTLTRDDDAPPTYQFVELNKVEQHIRTRRQFRPQSQKSRTQAASCPSTRHPRKRLGARTGSGNLQLRAIKRITCVSELCAVRRHPSVIFRKQRRALVRGRIRPQPFLRTEHPNGTARTHERALHIGQHLESDARKPFAGRSHIDRRDIPQSGKARTHLVTSPIEHASTQHLQHPRAAVGRGAAAESNIERLRVRLNRRAHELAHATRACRKGRLVCAGGGVYPRSLRHLDDRAEPPLPIGRKQKRRRMRTLDGRRNHDPPDLAPERRVKRLQRPLATVGNGNGHARKTGHTARAPWASHSSTWELVAEPLNESIARSMQPACGARRRRSARTGPGTEPPLA